MSCSTSNPAESALPQDIQDKIHNHPCYSEGAHHHYARIHVAVAPACNIQCNYCIENMTVQTSLVQVLQVSV